MSHPMPDGEMRAMRLSDIKVVTQTAASAFQMQPFLVDTSSGEPVRIKLTGDDAPPTDAMVYVTFTAAGPEDKLEDAKEHSFVMDPDMIPELLAQLVVATKTARDLDRMRN